MQGEKKKIFRGQRNWEQRNRGRKKWRRGLVQESNKNEKGKTKRRDMEENNILGI